MRKSIGLVLVLILTACLACAAADTELTLGPCSGKMLINENNYILLTPDNLAQHPDLLSSIGQTQEALLEDWNARGVLLQAWTKKMDACLEVSVYQDEESARYYDLEQRDRATRNEYLKLHQGSGRFAQDGFTILKPEWKKQKLGGNFLKFEYKRTVGEKTWRGLARKTVRNGYTVFLDYQVYDRLPRKSDEDYLNKIANTVSFDVIDQTAAIAEQAAASADGEPATEAPKINDPSLIQITVPAPLETNESTFTVEGKTTPGAHVVGVAMRWSNASKASRFEADAGKSGAFKVKFTLPEEGLWMITLSLQVDNAVVAEHVFPALTYSKTLLPVTLDAEIPEVLSSDQLVISGTTSKGVQIQCIVTKASDPTHSIFNNTVRTNGTGTFRFKVATADEDDYEISLSFSKKNYNIRSLKYKTTRKLTAQDVQDRTAAKAIHPSYAALVKSLDSYVGQNMVYEAYITDVSNPDDQAWVIRAALKKSKGEYTNILYFLSQQDPGFETGSKIKLYGSCIGSYEVQSEEDTESYPAFEYLFHE